MSGNRKKTMFAFYIILVSLIILAASSYAWMTISAAPIVSDLTMSVTTDNKLELAPDVDGAPGEWSSILDLSDPSGSIPVLKPVTFSAEQFGFLAPHYGLDGRVAFVDPIRLMDLNDEDVTHGVSAAADTDASRDYLFSCDFWIRAESTDTVVSLTQARVREQEELGNGTFVIGEPIWNTETILHEERGNGAQNAIRVAFLVDKTEKDPYRTFVIYEPNADANGERITYSTDGEDLPLESEFKLIRQRASTFTETDPVLRDTVLYSPGEFYEEDDLALFNLFRGEPRHVTMFVWLEGQDPDCQNTISEGRVFANIQFHGEQKDSPIYPD